VPKIRAAYLDGEIAVLGEDRVTSFAALQDALSRGQAQRLTYHVFDLLHLDGRDLTRLPLTERRTSSWSGRRRRLSWSGPVPSAAVA
jgi:bifunctional non-homologous end joining protein LigD